NVFIIDEREISKAQQKFIKEFFIQKVAPALVTIILNDLAEFPLLKDTSGYLAVKLVMKATSENSPVQLTKPTALVRYAIIEIPTTINRFVVLPNENEKQYVIMLDDVIRHNISSIFNIFEYESISVHMIKITRDAQLDIDSDMSKSMIQKIATSVKE